MNYFTLMGIEEKYDIDLNELEQKYFALQKKYHPDMHQHNKNEKTLDILDINNAYNILKTPLKRARYFLKVVGFERSEDDYKQALDTDTLNDIFAKREYVDSLDNIESLTKYLLEIQTNISEIYSMLSDLFSKQSYIDASMLIVKIQYMSMIENDIQEKMESYGFDRHN